jgi:hypothetical protein
MFLPMIAIRPMTPVWLSIVTARGAIILAAMTLRPVIVRPVILRPLVLRPAALGPIPSRPRALVAGLAVSERSLGSPLLTTEAGAVGTRLGRLNRAIAVAGARTSASPGTR